MLAFLHEAGGHSTLTEEQAAIGETMPDLVSITRWGDIIATLAGRGKWPIWAVEHFPTPGKEREALDVWKPITRGFALHRQVLVVMTTRIEGCWKAYCAPVPGMNHKEEEGPVLAHGCNVGERVARCLFPEMEGIPYDR